MKNLVFLAFALSAVVGVPVPSAEITNDLEVLQIPLQENKELDILSLADNDSKISERNKRTIGILRELFPELSKIVEQKIQMIIPIVLRTIGPIILRSGLGGLGGNSGNKSPGFNDDDDEDDDSNGEDDDDSNSNGRKVSISLPTFPPDEDDDDDDDEKDNEEPIKTTRQFDVTTLPATAITTDNFDSFPLNQRQDTSILNISHNQLKDIDSNNILKHTTDNVPSNSELSITASSPAFHTFDESTIGYLPPNKSNNNILNLVR